MKKMTEQNLAAAFAGESQASMRYRIFAQKAEEEGFPNVARLFRAIAYAEEIHAKNHLNVLGGIGTTAENLQTAINGENFEVQEMYPAYKAVAELQNEVGAQRSTHAAMEAERVHAGLYKKAKQAVQQGRDATVGKIYICSKCGWTVEGEAPDRCPLCGAPKEDFRGF